jgi:dipeptidase D
MSKEIKNLDPIALWSNFADLNAVPRPSKKEERVIAFMVNFGKKLGLETIVDRIGNVIIKKPATPGMENRQTVILQSHLDMVHQKNSDTVFDFDAQGIQMIVEGDWLRANGTTLGADNGIGVAAIMALLSAKGEDVKHPALEALFTIDEETGMTGAMELDPENLSGTILLNLDTEDDDELSIGCAGGIDTNTTQHYDEIPAGNDSVGYVLKIRGLKGGHSGMDIDKGRGNANKLMNRLLYGMDDRFFLQIASVDGGSLRNAIPRESVAIIAIPEHNSEAFEYFLKMEINTILAEFRTIEPDLHITFEKTTAPEKVMDHVAQRNFVNTIYSVPNGVYRMSPDIKGLVETSSSLARIIVKEGLITTQSLQRSSVESSKKDIANTVKAAFKNGGASVVQEGDYPGWQPKPDSPILHIMSNLYRDIFKGEPKIKACHAGLECGILGKHLPDTDMISFGPNIRHAHSPDECVQISSVQKFWSFLLTTLEEIPSI